MGVAGQENDDEIVTAEDEQTEDGSEEGQTEGQDGEGGEETEEVVQIGEEAAPPPEESGERDSTVITELRRRHRELDRENKELKARLEGGKPTTEAPRLPERPKLADFDYDEEQHQEAMDAWYAKKREVEAHEAAQAKAVEQAKEAARKVHEDYAASKQALKFKDFQEAEDEVLASLSEVQQALILEGAENPALVVYALGKNAGKLRELAAVTNPVKFAVALGKLEKDVKVTKRTSTSKPAPETTVRGNTSASTSSATLDRLRAEADKTGDRSKVVAYLKQQKQAGK
jgi:hypothetical protein